jgi:hypothetical protein
VRRDNLTVTEEFASQRSAPSVRPSASTKQLVNRLTNFHEIWYVKFYESYW